MPTFFKRLLKILAVIVTAVWGFFAAVLIGFVALIAVVIALSAGDSSAQTTSTLQLEHVAGNPQAQTVLASISINGIILGEPTPDAFGQLFGELGIVYGYEVQDTLLELAQDDDVAGVILELHSPGGTIFGTQAIVDGVQLYKEQTGKPVFAYVGSIAASGGYWVAASADAIFADAGTSIGSIGVFTGPFKYYDDVRSEGMGIFGPTIETAGGIQTEYISAGQYKDMGNPYRQLTATERSVLQGSVDSSYQQFVSFVAQQRELDEERVRSAIGALVFNEYQALELDLIDGLAGRNSVYAQLAERLELEEDGFQVKRVRTGGDFFDMLFGAAAGRVALGAGGSAATQGSVAKLPSFCHQSMVLAYAGNPFMYCR